MICPYCETANRDERDRCYHCEKDLSMLRLIVNRARHHYNTALEKAERGLVDDAIAELKNALELDSRHVNAHVVLGTLLARQERFDEARQAWKEALATNPAMLKAHEYIGKSDVFRRGIPALRFYRALSLAALLALAGVCAIWGIRSYFARRAASEPHRLFELAKAAYEQNRWAESQDLLRQLQDDNGAAQPLREAAQLFSMAIMDQVMSHSRLADQALAARDYVTAYEQLAYMKGLGLGPRRESQIEQTLAQIPDMARAELEQALGRYLEFGVGFERFIGRLTRIEEAIQNGFEPFKSIDTEAMRRQAAQARWSTSINETALIRADWLRDQNDEAALLRLNRLLETNAESEEAKAFHAMLLEKVQRRHNAEIDRMVEADRAQDVEPYLERVLAFLPESLQSKIREGIEPVEPRLARLEAKRYFARIRELDRPEMWDAFLEQAGKAREYALAAAQLADIETSATLIRQARAREYYAEVAALAQAGQWDDFLARAADAGQFALAAEWAEDLATTVTLARADKAMAFFAECCGRLDAAFDDPPGRRISQADAQRYLDEWDFIAQGIENAAPYRQRQARFYRAASAFIVGRDAEAKALFEEFVEMYSTSRLSDYLKSARRYLELIEQRRESANANAAAE